MFDFTNDCFDCDLEKVYVNTSLKSLILSDYLLIVLLLVRKSNAKIFGLCDFTHLFICTGLTFYHRLPIYRGLKEHVRPHSVSTTKEGLRF